MSEHRPDDPRIDDTLRQSLRERAAEQPRADIDARILAAAHRAVGSRPRPSGLRRWLPRIDTPFATAAVVMVSAALLLMRDQGQFENAVLKEIREPAPTTSPAMPMPGSEAAAPATVAPATAVPETRVDDTAAAEMSNESVSPAGVVGTTQAPASVTIPEAANDGSAIDGSAIGGSLRQEIETKTTATPGEGERAARSAVVPATGGAAEAVSAFPAAAPPAEDAESATAPAVQDEAAPPEAAKPMAPPIESDKRERRDAAKAAPAAAPAPLPGSAPVTSPGGDAVMSAPNSIDTDAGRPGPASESQADSADSTVGAARAKSTSDAATPAETEQQKALRAIRDLIAVGRFSDAQLALARFVRTYPDYRVPADILQALKPAD
jgi:hypothetical protein